ncbi:MAG TPA: glycosyltransferase family 4 protein [Trichocoleus sp.]
MVREKVAIIMGENLGWATMRKSWEASLSQDQEYEFTFFHPEGYARSIYDITDRLKRFNSIGSAIGGSRAAKHAIAEGYRKIIVASTHYAAFLPPAKKVKYCVYGDATIRQIDALGYTLHKPNPYSLKGLLQYLVRSAYCYMYDRATSRLAKHGSLFLCVSKWYAKGLIDEHNVPPNQTKVLPLLIDTDYWSPAENSPKSENLRIVFVGGDFARKGGYALLEVCEMEDFRDCQFHFVTRWAPDSAPSNAVFHTQMAPNSTELRDLVRSCDLFVLPTQGDCSSIALLEAASCGLPAVISNVGGIAELVDNYQTAILLEVPSPSAIAEAIRVYRDNPDKLAAHGEAARRKMVREFDRRVSVDRVKEVVAAMGMSQQQMQKRFAGTWK